MIPDRDRGARGGPDIAAHYHRLAPDFTRHWSYSDAFVGWMTSRLLAHAAVGGDSRVLDVGCGTGLYSQRLADHTHQLLVCVDPSTAMLDRISDSPRLVPVNATAESVARGEAPLPYRKFDAVVVKEAQHHVSRDVRESTVRGLARLLAPDGRLIVVMMPTHCCGHQHFTDAELDAGITEIRRTNPGGTVTFPDRYTVLVAH